MSEFTSEIENNEELPKRRGKPPLSRPEVSASAQKELDKAQDQFDEFDHQVKQAVARRTDKVEEQEPQTKLSSKELEKKPDIYLKPTRSYPPGVNPKTGEKEKFNEKFRDDWNYSKEYVHFIAEHKELIGETIELWTKPFPGVPCEEWKVPTNKPVWGPRYLAEQIARKFYHRLKTEDRPIAEIGSGITQTGQMVVDTTIQRLSAVPVTRRKSIFMNGAGF